MNAEHRQVRTVIGSAPALKLIVAGVVAAAALLAVARDWLWPIDHALYDVALLAYHRPAPEDVIIVAVDEESLPELGAWPLPRRVYAAVVDVLHRAGAKVIAIDVIFADTNPLDAEGDRLLVAHAAESGRVVMPVAFEHLRQDGQLIELVPFPALAAVAAGFGHVDVELDSGGRSRRLFLSAGLGAPVWPAFALAALQVADPIAAAAAGGWGARLRQADVDEGARDPFVWVRRNPFLVAFAGPPGHFRRVGLADVIHGRVPTDVFRDATVFVGATAVMTGDRLAVGGITGNPMMSGVEFNANAFDALRRGLLLRPLAPLMAIALTLGLISLPALVHAAGMRRAPVLVAGGLLSLITSAALLAGAQLWFSPAAALLALVICGLAWTAVDLDRERGEIRSERAIARTALRSISDAVMTLDGDGRIRHMNTVAQRLTGSPEADAIGRPVDGVVCLSDAIGRARISIAALAASAAAKGVMMLSGPLLRSKSGEERKVQVSLAVIRAASGAAEGAVLVFTDVTDLHRMANAIAEQAGRDQITQLQNRKAFLQRLGRVLSAARREELLVAVLELRLDKFSTVSEDLGPAAAELLLKGAVERLCAVVDRPDLLARVNTDSFALIVDTLRTLDAVTFLAHRLRKAFDAPFVIQGFKAWTSLSIGVAYFPRDARAPDPLLTRAGQAARRARQAGGNKVHYCADHANVVDINRARLVISLKSAVERQDTALLYQPQVDFKSGRTVGIEALLRLSTPRMRGLGPAEFVPMIEEAGLIGAAGEWVLRTACCQLREWHQLGWNDLFVSINLTPRQLLESGLTERIRRVLDEAGLDGRYLWLEITELALLSDYEQAAAVIQGIRELGVSFCIDDFGTTCSSLLDLERLPIQGVKIDAGLIQEGIDHPEHAAVIAAIAVMAHAMRLDVVAKGVETQRHVDFVIEREFDRGQGYFIGRPVSAAQFLSYLSANISTG
ncbi:putative Cyclic di-GMP phosphodiesterase Gmr [uncultured Defluviicoccus sp.]|uniref:Putative Cyclic di-GMP phosphodiesterase Gmr n=1 Tax=metagenome TaxID=256318 RepID=A0A380TM72_9ZZZZ|nr:putative Cyclic di-GMP phosphodiesterase Gmr [uncultured Defluviicoccus sp.]